MSSTQINSNLPIFNFVRGILAILVAICHCGTERIRPPSGAIWVDFFMIVSGFLMTHQFLIREKKEPLGAVNTIKNFYIRRFFRISPLYYFLFLLSIVFFYESMANNEKWPLPWTIFNHITYIFGFIPDGGGNSVMPDWSIGLEMQFYLFFPLILWILAKKGASYLIVISGLLVFISHKLWGVYSYDRPEVFGLFTQPSLLPLRILHFSAGMILAWIYWKKITSKSTLITLTLLLFLSIFAYERNHSKASLGVILIILITYSLPKLKPILKKVFLSVSQFSEHKIFTLLADLSYGVYLLHTMCIIWLKSTVFSWGLGPWPEFIVFSLFVILASIVLSYIFHRMIEKPMINFGKRLTTRTN